MSTSMTRLPGFVRPMLAKRSEPFDSREYLFEVKWDGIRAITVIDTGGYRLLNRRGVDMTSRYPEFCFLKDLPAGTILDGELVVFDGGRPSLARVLGRENATSPVKIRTLAQSRPGLLVVFDQLYDHFRPIMGQSLEVRRRCLQETVAGYDPHRIVVSQAVPGNGRAFFREVVRRDLEGVMAKRLGSRYLSNKRSDAWLKIKKRSTILCVILGFQPPKKLRGDFRSLILAANGPHGLRFVGKVATEFTGAERQEINGLLRSRAVSSPLVSCAESGQWVEADLYCEVSYLERTSKGELRDPVFDRLIFG